MQTYITEVHRADGAYAGPRIVADSREAAEGQAWLWNVTVVGVLVEDVDAGAGPDG